MIFVLILDGITLSSNLRIYKSNFMATTRFKFRASSVSGKQGTLFIQVIHQRVARQVSTKCLSLKNVESKNVIKDGKTSSPNAVRPSRVGKKTKEPRGQTSNGRSKTQDSSSKSCGSCAAYQIK